jgi:3-isopropylmalate/(R)-2-methylmalate dehydratase small subunit
MPCVVASGGDIRAIAQLIESDPAVILTLDLTEKKLSIADTDFPVTIPAHAHEALVSGKWDAIADLLEGLDDVKARAASLPYMAA